MRLFVAAELPDVLTNALAETSALLRGSVWGRYVGPDLFHVTLAFLGDVPQVQVADAAAAVRSACAGHASFLTSLGELGTFGRSSSAVLWQGFAQARPTWDVLAHDVRASLRQAGFSLDEKGFIPHVTLMRRADLSRGMLPMPQVARGRVETVTLFCSDLSGARPRYEALERFGLG